MQTNVDNLLNQEPPLLAGAGFRSTASPPGAFAQFHFTTNPAFYDRIGRRYRVGVRFKF